MKELINRYIRNRLRIEDNLIYIVGDIGDDVKDTFDLYSFSMMNWAAKNISNEYCFVYEDGGQYWYKEGKEHRTNGPAKVHPDGRFDTEWYKEGKRHRLDGPAVTWVSGAEFYYLNGKEYTKNEFDAALNR